VTTQYHYYGSIRSSFWYKLVLCCLITLVVMYSHRFLPTKRLDIVPGKDVRAYLFGDNNSAGVSMASWIDEPGLSWQCDIQNDGKNHSCGFSISLDSHDPKGIDLSKYDSVNVELDYDGGDKRLRFFSRTYVEGFSNLQKDSGSAKYQNVLIPATFLRKPLTIQMNEFFVAEWWISEYQVPREYVLPDFRNALTFGVDLSYPTAPGLHKFKLKKVQFVGLWVSAERWYLGILVFWILLMICAGAYNLWLLKLQNRAERQRLEALISKNTVLESETNRYRQLSMLDQLTGLLNRHGLSEYIQSSFPDKQPHEVSLIIVDVDFFKKINDTYGHDGGDKVLQTVAKVIRENVRGRDSAARWGGEEFVVILPDTRLEEARIAAEKLRSLVASINFEGMPDLQVTISLGVGAISGIEPFHMLFRRVDVALYQAKAQGRNRVVIAQD